MKGIVVVALVLAFATSAGARERETVEFLQEAANAKIESDLPSAMKRTLADSASAKVWRDALRLMRDHRLGTLRRYAAVARLMSAAALLSGQKADNLPLETLTREDISAMVDALAFPHESDLIRYLLARGPSLRTAGMPGGYTAIRLAPEGQPRLILERSDRPLLGLGLTFSSKLLTPENDPVSKPRTERAKTRRATLASIPPMIIAAKAYRNGVRANPAERPYAALIALEALNDAVKADPRHMRVVGYSGFTRAEKSLLEAADVTPLSPDLQGEQTLLALKLPSIAFFARQFDEAAKAYKDAPLPGDNRRGRTWKLWGIAISRFAARENVSTDLQSLVDALDASTAQFARIALRFFEALPAEDAASLPGLSGWRARAKTLANENALYPQERYQADLDFVRIMETIARPDIAGPFLMSRIGETRGQPFESRYLYRLAPFVRDYCNLISFRISRHGEWVRRSGAGYDPLLDFLDNFHPSGRLTKSGEVVRPSAGRVPYPALNPEEDCAVILVASGIANGLLAPGKVPDMSAEFENWVRESIERKTPPPSLAPYLKLLFVDWFASAFEVLKVRSLPASGYRYTPRNASPLASPNIARKLIDRTAMPAGQRAILKLFLQTRTFLEDKYSK